MEIEKEREWKAGTNCVLNVHGETIAILRESLCELCVSQCNCILYAYVYYVPSYITCNMYLKIEYFYMIRTRIRLNRADKNNNSFHLRNWWWWKRENKTRPCQWKQQKRNAPRASAKTTCVFETVCRQWTKM